MKNILQKIGVILLLSFSSFHSFAGVGKSSESLTLSDTIVFDLASAEYSSAGGIFYIDIPVLLHSNFTGINGLDFYFAFNLNKMTYESTVSMVGGLSTLSYFNPVSQLLTNTSSGTSVTYSAPLYTQLLKLRFVLAGACTEIVTSDFSNIVTLVNGNLSSSLFVAPTGIPPFEIQQPEPYCSADALIFSYPITIINGRDIVSYDWNFGNGQLGNLQSESVTYGTAGDYPVELTIVTEDGCVFSQEDSVPVLISPVAAFSSSYDAILNVVSFTNESTIASGSIASYNWDFGNGTSTLESPDHTFPALDFYDVSLTVTSDLGCSASVTQLVSATDNVLEFANRSFTVFPNPAASFLNVESSFHTLARITDVTGRVVVSNLVIQGAQTTTIDVSMLAGGYYFIENMSSENVVRARFLKEN